MTSKMMDRRRISYKLAQTRKGRKRRGGGGGGKGQRGIKY